MARHTIRRHSKIFDPVAVGSAETLPLFAVKKGNRVVWASARKDILSAGTTATIALRVSAAGGGQAAGLIAATALNGGAVGDLINGLGPDLAFSGGFLVTADGTVDAVYAPGGTPGATNPRVHITCGITREYPY